MARIGYARVSTIDQDLDGQLATLKAEGCTIIRSEKVSGASRSGRSELATVLQFLRTDDELVVTRLDRLGRDTRDVLNLIHECEQRGASVTVLDPHFRRAARWGTLSLPSLAWSPKWNGASSKSDSVKGLQQPRRPGAIEAGSLASTAPRSWPAMRPEKQ